MHMPKEQQPSPTIAGPIRAIGILSLRIARRLGWQRLAAKINHRVKYVPSIVTSSIGSDSGRRRIRMYSDGGLDHVVRFVWNQGIEQYETPLPAFVARLGSSSGTMLDVGANSGLFSFIAAACGFRSVHAFEPYPPALEMLRRNRHLNDVEETVTVVPLAVGDASGTTTLYVPAKRFGDVLETSSSLNPEFRPEHSEKVEVAVTTIDDYVEQEGLKHVDLIHLDVESYEPQVLEGAMKTINGQHPIVVFEVNRDVDLDRLNHIRGDLERESDIKTILMRSGSLEVVDHISFVEGDRNCIFCHSSKLEMIAELAKDMKLSFA